MSSDSSNQQASSPDILGTLSTWAENFHRNTTKAFSDASPKDYIRLVVIIGAYALLRPYLMKLGAKLQAREHEKANQEAEDNASMTANDIREGKTIQLPGLEPEDEESEDEGVSNWGKKAKLRQRKFIRQRLEEHEALLKSQQQTESDEEIEEFLED